MTVEPPAQSAPVVITDENNSPHEIIPDRIFVGNLPYDVAEDDVRNLTPEFNVVSVEIPRKNFFDRELGDYVVQSKGYGFITYTNSEDAAVAIKSIAGKVISGREIYAKYALPQNKHRLKGRGFQFQKFPFPPMPFDAKGAIGPFFSQPFYPAMPMPMPNFKAPITHTHNFKGEDNDNSLETETLDQNENQTRHNQISPIHFSSEMANVKPFFPTPTIIGRPIDHFAIRKEEKQRRLANGVPSELTVFVGNLEKNVTADHLREFFKELQPQWIKVPRQSFPPQIYKMMRENGNIQNKGIAFVRFEDHQTQQKAISLFDGKEFRGKRLNVTVAINTNDEPTPEFVPISVDTNLHNEEKSKVEAETDAEADTEAETETEAEVEVEVVVGNESKSTALSSNEASK